MGFGWNLSETNFEHQQLETWFLENPIFCLLKWDEW
jgi:hypothetical protein